MYAGGEPPSAYGGGGPGGGPCGAVPWEAGPPGGAPYGGGGVPGPAVYGGGASARWPPAGPEPRLRSVATVAAAAEASAPTAE